MDKAFFDRNRSQRQATNSSQAHKVDHDPASNPAAWQRNAGERIGGQDGYHRSLMNRGQDIAKAYADNEFRIDTNADSITSLQAKYAREFAAAEKRMEERKSSWTDSFRNNVRYDYDGDRLFQEWSKDKERAREVLHIHYLDEWLDSPQMLTSHALKVTTTLGGAHGAYRGYRLWNNIDQQYAKLNGVSFRSLMTQEVSIGILRGTAIGIAMGAGGLVGDVMARIIGCFVFQYTVARDRRRWQNVVAAATVSGFMGGVVSSLMLKDLLSWRGMFMLTGAYMSGMFMIGLGLGYFVYKPFEEEHGDKAYDDPHWRPWNKREFMYDGPVGIRGRYV